MRTIKGFVPDPQSLGVCRLNDRPVVSKGRPMTLLRLRQILLGGGIAVFEFANKGLPMFDGTSLQNDRSHPNTVVVGKNPPWQLYALLLALLLVNCLAAVFCPDCITNPGLKF